MKQKECNKNCKKTLVFFFLKHSHMSSCIFLKQSALPCWHCQYNLVWIGICVPSSTYIVSSSAADTELSCFSLQNLRSLVAPLFNYTECYGYIIWYNCKSSPCQWISLIAPYDILVRWCPLYNDSLTEVGLVTVCRNSLMSLFLPVIDVVVTGRSSMRKTNWLPMHCLLLL